MVDDATELQAFTMVLRGIRAMWPQLTEDDLAPIVEKIVTEHDSEVISVADLTDKLLDGILAAHGPSPVTIPVPLNYGGNGDAA